MDRFRHSMDESNPDWKLQLFARLIFYYFAGTMQEGVLFIPREDEAVYWRRITSGQWMSLCFHVSNP